MSGIMTTKSNHKGFTLVEVMIVVAIIAILSAVAIPAIMTTVPRYRLRAEARELMINFKKAKVEAVKHNKDAVILFTNAVGNQGGSYQIFINVDNIKPYTFDAGDILIGTYQVGNNMKLVSNFPDNGAGLKVAGFDSRGLPLNFSTVNLGTSDDTRIYTISVSSAGNVRLQ